MNDSTTIRIIVIAVFIWLMTSTIICGYSPSCTSHNQAVKEAWTVGE